MFTYKILNNKECISVIFSDFVLPAARVYILIILDMQSKWPEFIQNPCKNQLWEIHV